MNPADSLKIDIYSHIAPRKYVEALDQVAPGDCAQKIFSTPPLFDLEQRFRIMDRYEGLVQVLTLSWPAVEEVADPGKAADLSRRANDELAELVLKYPDRFAAAIACLPMNNMEAAMEEVDRVINALKFRGVLLYSNVNDKPLDLPEFLPLYEKMSKNNLPVFIHPRRPLDSPDYRTEDVSRYDINSVFGWPYETTVVMTRFVFSGILERFPNLKIVTHHCGGMVPYYGQRIVQHYAKFETMATRKYMQGLTKAPIDYYRMFYNDTAVHGNTPALMCAYAFFGADHLLFGTDMPLGDREFGARSYRQTIHAINAMEISEVEKKKIFEDNARELMRLPL